jgi:hypothetical protein
MPKLTAMKISIKCLWTIKLEFTGDSPELVTEIMAYIANCSVIHRNCSLFIATRYGSYVECWRPRYNISWGWRK